MVLDHGETAEEGSEITRSPWVDADAVAGDRFKLGEMVSLLWRS